MSIHPPIQTLNQEQFNSWLRIHRNIAAPASLEADMILKEGEKKAWNGGFAIPQGGIGRTPHYHIHVHNCRPRFSVLDAWNFYPHTRAYRVDPMTHDPRSRAQKKEDQEAFNKVMRFAIGVICGIGVYYTAQSLKYAYEQNASAIKAIEAMKIEIPDLNDREVESLVRTLINDRTALMNDARNRSGTEMLDYALITAGLAVIAFAAFSASMPLGVLGGAIVLAGSVDHLFKFSAGTVLEESAKRQLAEKIRDCAAQILNVRFVMVEDALPTYDEAVKMDAWEEQRPLYPDIGQMAQNLG